MEANIPYATVPFRHKGVRIGQYIQNYLKFLRQFLQYETCFVDT